MLKNSMADLEDSDGFARGAFGEHNGKIGPHEGRIVELMLSGKKPVCHLVHGYDDREIEILNQAAADGKLVTMPGSANIYDGKECQTQLFCQPDQIVFMERAAILLSDARQGTIAYDADFHRELGRMLGYSEDDINHFIAQQGLAP